ncbi:MAG: hypothetical protein HY900_00145 [Deltaproteobacteria bacterium]|nr:hypothetical protein [Deltaproteobacteria bacterium]
MIRPATPTLALLLLLCAGGTGAASADETYSFDLSETEKKPYHVGGYVEARPLSMRRDPDAAFQKLRLLDGGEEGWTSEWNGRLQLEASVERGPARLFVRPNVEYETSRQGDDLEANLFEAYLSVKPSPSFTTEAGKKSLRWGKGYAWNPVAFLDRPKNPEDPELSLEGFTVLSADYIRCFSDPFQTVSFTPVLLPVFEGVNEEFGDPGHWNLGGKLYALFRDTDLDLLFLTGGSRTTRYGVDFSRNFGTNFEVHGEFAYVPSLSRPVVDRQGRISRAEHAAKSYLLGVRYLTELETTYIVEYYYNGTGFRPAEMKAFFALVDEGAAAFEGTADRSILQKAASLAEGGYGRPNAMRNYLYARVSQKEPFDVLYFTPAVTAIANLDDRSFSLSPEFLYTGITNLELRLKGTLLHGERGSEYGEKQNDAVLELRARLYF